jgi:hypothetical protein
MKLSFEHSDAWPQDNETAEDQLRNQLRDFEVLTADGARKEAARLDAEHTWRRRTVWADLGLAALAWIAGEQDRPGWLPLFVDFGWEVAWLLGFRGWQ